MSGESYTLATWELQIDADVEPNIYKLSVDIVYTTNPWGEKTIPVTSRTEKTIAVSSFTEKTQAAVTWSEKSITTDVGTEKSITAPTWTEKQVT